MGRYGRDSFQFQLKGFKALDFLRKSKFIIPYLCSRLICLYSSHEWGHSLRIMPASILPPSAVLRVVPAFAGGPRHCCSRSTATRGVLTRLRHPSAIRRAPQFFVMAPLCCSVSRGRAERIRSTRARGHSYNRGKRRRHRSLKFAFTAGGGRCSKGVSLPDAQCFHVPLTLDASAAGAGLQLTVCRKASDLHR